MFTVTTDLYWKKQKIVTEVKSCLHGMAPFSDDLTSRTRNRSVFGSITAQDVDTSRNEFADRYAMSFLTGH